MSNNNCEYTACAEQAVPAVPVDGVDTVPSHGTHI